MEEKKIHMITAVLLIFNILILSVGFLLVKRQEFSENENRYLAVFPECKWEEIKSGQFMDDVNSYLCDHFPLRDAFIGMKSRAEIILGKREINDVYIGKDDYLIEVYQKPVNTERISRIFSSFAEKEKTKYLDLKDRKSVV